MTQRTLSQVFSLLSRSPRVWSSPSISNRILQRNQKTTELSTDLNSLRILTWISWWKKRKGKVQLRVDVSFQRGSSRGIFLSQKCRMTTWAREVPSMARGAAAGISLKWPRLLTQESFSAAQWRRRRESLSSNHSLWLRRGHNSAWSPSPMWSLWVRSNLTFTQLSGRRPLLWSSPALARLSSSPVGRGPHP